MKSIKGTQAKFRGIWSCSTSKNNLFKDFATLQDYVDYLNREFLTSYNNRSLSEGSNHHIKIKDFFS